MNISHLILPLSLSLLAAPALAQQPNASDKEHANGMSYQDYENQREKILKRMKAPGQQQQGQQAPQGNAKAQPARPSTYGQGYGSRNEAAEKPTVEKPSRPERPQFERIERAGRP